IQDEKMVFISDPKKVIHSTFLQRQDSAADWQRRIGRHCDTSSPGWQDELTRICTIISEFSQPGRLLDLAGAEGFWTEMLAERASVVTFDADLDNLAHNRNQLARCET